MTNDVVDVNVFHFNDVIPGRPPTAKSESKSITKGHDCRHPIPCPSNPRAFPLVSLDLSLWLYLHTQK